MKKVVECVICKKCFEKEVGAINRSPRHCCSKECQNKAVRESQRKHEFSPYLLDTKKRATILLKKIYGNYLIAKKENVLLLEFLYILKDIKILKIFFKLL